MKKKKKQNVKTAIPDAGLFISELADLLRREGHDATAQQFRKYEKGGIFQSSKIETNNYRFYTPTEQDKIRTVYLLKLIGFPLRKIRHFFSLKEQIMRSPLLEDKEVTTKEGDIGYRKGLAADSDKNSAAYQRFSLLIEDFSLLCDEINEKLSKMRTIVDRGVQKISAIKADIKKKR